MSKLKAFLLDFAVCAAVDRCDNTYTIGFAGKSAVPVCGPREHHK